MSDGLNLSSNLCKADPPGWRRKSRILPPHWYEGGRNYNQPHVIDERTRNCVFCGARFDKEQTDGSSRG